jgi:acid phosphatase
MYQKCLSLAAAIAFFGLLANSQAWAQIPAACPAPAPEALDSSDPPNLDLIKSKLLYYRCTQYDSDVAKALAEALEWVAMRAAQVSKPAIVLDIDETALSNWTRIQKNKFAYFPDGPCDLDNKNEACGEIAWEKSARAPALKPTLDLFNFAKCKDLPARANCKTVAVFFITGRIQSADEEDATRQNLSNAGYRDWDGLYLRDDPSTNGRPGADAGKVDGCDGDPSPVTVFKTKARIDIEGRLGYTIIANVGDQESDLRCGHSERKFKVPNPFYFIP